MTIALLTSIGIFIGSLILLLLASDWFVDASEQIGLSLGISPFVIGVTIVAFGTSLPELAASIVGVINGQSEIVIGNVIGSNIANICLVLGLVASVVGTIKMDSKVLDIDVPVLVISALLMWLFTFDGTISKLDGILLTGMLILFLINSFRSSDSDNKVEATAGWRSYLLVIVGGFGVYFGATYVVYSIQQISDAFGISSGIIAMSAVALGTSLPEVIVSLAAARKGKPSMAIGNVVGSNIFNSFGVLGIPALFGTIHTPNMGQDFTLYYMIGLTVLFGFFAAAKNISRWEGIMLVALYIIFMAELFV